MLLQENLPLGTQVFGIFWLFISRVYMETNALQIQSQLEKEHFRIIPENPFEEEKPFLSIKIESSYPARVHLLWNAYRDIVIRIFPSPSKISDKKSYFKQLEKIYIQDAYNSLSIEGYRVTDELIQQVIEKGWNPEENSQDRTRQDALAALGYFKSFQLVKESIGRILDGASPSAEAEKNLPNWMRALFEPMIDAHILRPEDLIGYRRSQVYIRGSRHIPFPREAILDAMQAFYNCLRNEPHPAVRAVLGRFLFVYIHPYMDGNGRTARFLMNAMFASGGYPWAIIQAKNRDRYFEALEAASVASDIEPLALFIKEEMLY
jgi:Fic family protein